GIDDDPRRFRPNLLIETAGGPSFLEDAWVGRRLRIGKGEENPVVSVCTRDVRCVMLNLDPESGVADARLMKAAVRLNQNCAGVYCAIVRVGVVRVGEAVYLD